MCSVAEEDLAPVGDVPSEFDPVVVYPRVQELPSCDEPEIESRAVTPVRRDSAFHLQEVLRDLGPDLISLLGNGRSDKHAGRAHLESFRGSRDDSGLEAAPASVHYADPTGRCVEEGERHAVGDKYGERKIGGVDEDGVRFARLSDLGTVEHCCAMNLVNGEEVIRVNAGRAGDKVSILAHALLVVTHVVAKVQGLIRSRAHAVKPVGHKNVDTELGQGECGIHGQCLALLGDQGYVSWHAVQCPMTSRACDDARKPC